MTDQQPIAKVPATLATGGQVMAIVPQTFEEIQRVANMVLAAGVAPAALISGKDQAAQIAAVSTAIMAGAELGLPPMVSLRSFTVINGKPALYADGNVAVIRKAKSSDGQRIAEYISAGFQRGEGDADTFGFCEAKRADTGEVHREEFSVEDAKLAGLWDTRDKVKRFKKGGESYEAQNDSPWHRYPKRMMIWRATGYCLRWLFADVLGGMPDEYEAREIAGMIDITPQAPVVAREEPPEPPAPPVENEDQSEMAAGVIPEPGTGGVESEAVSKTTAADIFLAELEEGLSTCTDAAEVENMFRMSDAEAELEGADLDKALEMKKLALWRVNRPTEADGQSDMLAPFPGDLPR